MATLPDMTLTAEEYKEVYADTGITPALALRIQNKSSSHVYIQYGGSKPTGSSDNGFIIRELEVWSVPSGNSVVWLRGNGTVAVESA